MTAQEAARLTTVDGREALVSPQGFMNSLPKNLIKQQQTVNQRGKLSLQRTPKSDFTLYSGYLVQGTG